jgi:hypothetical protein
MDDAYFYMTDTSYLDFFFLKKKGWICSLIQCLNGTSGKHVEERERERDTKEI